MKKNDLLADLNRRDFLRGGGTATLMMMMGGIPILAEDKPEEKKAEDAPTQYKTDSAPLNIGVVGCGYWGRDILKALASLPNAPVVAICDTYEPFINRAKESAPNAQTHSDYRKLIEQKDVQGVVVATPSHQHKDIVLAALQAGKHVYCEAPLAHTVEDARAIAKAAKDNLKLNFQVGLQTRADKQMTNLLTFVRTGVLGKNVKIRSQWHKKQSWRRTSPNPDREKEINWRLQKDLSTGLVGELGIHQVDLASWFLLSNPTSVAGYGSITNWDDGRDVPDTVTAVMEFPGGVQVTFECTLSNSFDSSYDVVCGTDSAIMIRERKAWMFKEVDSPLLGWEVYARKENFYKESGIVLGANATKLAAQGDKPSQDAAADEVTPLQYAFKSFVSNSGLIQSGVEDFNASFDPKDTAALKQYLDDLKSSRMPAAGFKEGLAATVTALKANEALLKGERLALQPDWYALA